MHICLLHIAVIPFAMPSPEMEFGWVPFCIKNRSDLNKKKKKGSMKQHQFKYLHAAEFPEFTDAV